MARRMFSPDIVTSDAFVEMPSSSQALYFHLGMHADDDGFVNPRRVMRMVGAQDDDLRVLIAKRFVLAFESGVVVIKHWLIHNLIRADLYKETLYKREKKMLGLNDNGAYTELRSGVSELKSIEAPKWLRRRRESVRTANVPQTAHRLGKDRLDTHTSDSEPMIEIIGEELETVESDQTTPRSHATHRNTNNEYSPEFLKFWDLFPKKAGKRAANAVWESIKAPKSLQDKIFKAVEANVRSKEWQKEQGRYIPLPSNWLRDERWEDEVAEVRERVTSSSVAATLKL